MRNLRTQLALWLAPWLRQPTTLNFYTTTTAASNTTTPYIVWRPKEEEK